MSTLRPRGAMLEVNGQERRLLFTLNAIDAVQDRFGKNVNEVLRDITDEYPAGHTLRDTLKILLDDEVEREKHTRGENCPEEISEKEIGWLIGVDNYLQIMGVVFDAYGISIPEPDENSPNMEGGQQRS